LSWTLFIGPTYQLYGREKQDEREDEGLLHLGV